MKIIAPVIMALLIAGCSTEPVSNIINVEIAPDQLKLEKRPIKISKFESELKYIVTARLKKGVRRNDLTVNLVVDNKTQRGDIIDLETAMRKLNVRKIRYSSVDSDKQVLLNLE
ncbi:hypothetical protein [Chryseolinea sp. H1M3-3]|uniref:hypothetical protein n=1 Tax=Chryseolinea sp. H1M3-3 TaxID=3034144 RepID=UPI0023EAEC4F|nr:hypothetical protein [Chryseolinea sp. H1M3-3]